MALTPMVFSQEEEDKGKGAPWLEDGNGRAGGAVRTLLGQWDIGIGRGHRLHIYLFDHARTCIIRTRRSLASPGCCKPPNDLGQKPVASYGQGLPLCY